jgi:hypothetical protein
VRPLTDLVVAVDTGGLRDAEVVDAGGLREGVFGRLLEAGVVPEVAGVVVDLLGIVLADVVVVVLGFVSVVPDERASDAAVGAYNLDWLELGVFALVDAATGAEVPCCGTGGNLVVFTVTVVFPVPTEDPVC